VAAGASGLCLARIPLAVRATVRVSADWSVFTSHAVPCPRPLPATAPGNFHCALTAGLKALFGGDPNVDQITSGDLAGDYPAVQYTPPDGRYTISILARLGEAFRFEDLEAENIVVEGGQARVATARMLYRMKRDTIRPQDRIDAETIRQRFGLEEKEKP
jgi:hypothetical protein